LSQRGKDKSREDLFCAEEKMDEKELSEVQRTVTE
jgi:hypothetical protein